MNRSEAMEQAWKEAIGKGNHIPPIPHDFKIGFNKAWKLWEDNLASCMGGDLASDDVKIGMTE